MCRRGTEFAIKSRAGKAGGKGDGGGPGPSLYASGSEGPLALRARYPTGPRLPHDGEPDLARGLVKKNWHPLDGGRADVVATTFTASLFARLATRFGDPRTSPRARLEIPHHRGVLQRRGRKARDATGLQLFQTL